MSNATQIAWAAVRECNEAIKAAADILALPKQKGWYFIDRGKWVVYTRALLCIVDRAHHLGWQQDAVQIIMAESRGISEPKYHGQVQYDRVSVTLERLGEHHAELTKIYEATK